MRYDLYVAASVLIAVGGYLKSPAVCLGTVVLWGIIAAENILTKASKDAEIVLLLSRMEKLEKEHKSLSMDITNVAERAKTVLGEVY